MNIETNPSERTLHTGTVVDEALSEFMKGDIKFKTMNAYERDIVKFQEYLKRRGAASRVQNYLLDPIESTLNGTQDQAIELALYAKALSEDETLSSSAFDA